MAKLRSLNERVVRDHRELLESNRKLRQDLDMARSSSLSKKGLPLTKIGYTMMLLPEGVIVKRIFSRKGRNQWRVTYHNRNQEYYSPKLELAIEELFKNHPDIKKRYDDNFKNWPVTPATPSK